MNAHHNGQDDDDDDTPIEDPPGPNFEDFVNDPEIREMYADPEVSQIFTEIENDPATIATHHQNPKIQRVLQLIQKKFDPFLPERPQLSPEEQEQLLLLQQQQQGAGPGRGQFMGLGRGAGQGLGQFMGQGGESAQMEAIMNMLGQKGPRNG